MSDLDRVTLSGRLVADRAEVPAERHRRDEPAARLEPELHEQRRAPGRGPVRRREVYGKPGEALAQRKAKGDFLLVDGRLRQHA